MTDAVVLPTLAVLGGTGKEGKGLVYRWAAAGYPVIVGSRSAPKAEATASELRTLLGKAASVTALSNAEAAAQADIVVLAVPYTAHRSTLESVKDAVAGKILIDVTSPLVPPKVTKVQMPPAGSATQEARDILGPDSQVASAFQVISYEHLMKNEPVDCDVLVTGSSKQTREEALKLVRAAGFVGWDAGPIENSVVVEGLVSVLININKTYGSTHAGIRITGVARE